MCTGSCCTSHTYHAIIFLFILTLLLWPNAPNLSFSHLKNNQPKTHATVKSGGHVTSPPCTTTSTPMVLVFLYGVVFTLVLLVATNSLCSSPKHTDDYSTRSRARGANTTPRSMSFGSTIAPELEDIGVEGGGIGYDLLRTFPTFSYSVKRPPKMGKETSVCAICQSKFRDEQLVRWLPECDHLFHIACIDEWLAAHKTCPCCRADVELAPSQGSFSDTTPNDHIYDYLYEFDLG